VAGTFQVFLLQQHTGLHAAQRRGILVQKDQDVHLATLSLAQDRMLLACCAFCEFPVTRPILDFHS
jgi:hypothetical protein